jgi:hypothetical protein
VGTDSVADDQHLCQVLHTDIATLSGLLIDTLRTGTLYFNTQLILFYA